MEESINRLEQEVFSCDNLCDTNVDSANGNDTLDYIFTVDIFNEGVDIPAVNESHIYSVFDLLYTSYYEKLLDFMKMVKNFSEYKSENLYIKV